MRALDDRELSEQGGTRENQFIVELSLDGKAHQDIKKLEENVKSQLGLAEVQELENKNPFTITPYANERRATRWKTFTPTPPS